MVYQVLSFQVNHLNCWTFKIFIVSYFVVTWPTLPISLSYSSPLLFTCIRSHLLLFMRLSIRLLLHLFDFPLQKERWWTRCTFFLRFWSSSVWTIFLPATTWRMSSSNVAKNLSFYFDGEKSNGSFFLQSLCHIWIPSYSRCSLPRKLFVDTSQNPCVASEGCVIFELKRKR